MAKFEVLQVFYNRTLVETELRTSLIEELQKHSATVSSFQLLDIKLPNELNDELKLTEVLNIEIETTKLQQIEEEAKAEGQIAKAKQAAQVIVNQAEGDAAAAR